MLRFPGVLYCTRRDLNLGVCDRWVTLKTKRLASAYLLFFLFHCCSSLLVVLLKHPHIFSLSRTLSCSLWVMLPRGASGDRRFTGLKVIFSRDCWSLPYILREINLGTSSLALSLPLASAERDYTPGRLQPQIHLP